MFPYLIIDAATGAVLRRMYANTIGDLAAALGPDEMPTIDQPGVYPETHRLDLVTRAFRPLDLTPGIDRARRDQRDHINAERDRMQDAGVDTVIGRVDSTLSSRVDILGAIEAIRTAAALGVPLPPRRWTLADNTRPEVTDEEISTAGLAVVAYRDSIHERALVLKARIDAATTVEQVYAVTWTLADDAA